MYIDSQLEFSDAQAVTATAISANVIDTLVTTGAAASAQGTYTVTNASLDLGQDNEPMFLVIQAAAAFGGTGNITVSLESSAAVGLGSATVHYTGPAIAVATFTAGYRYATIALPHGDYLRYVGLRYTCSGTPSGGTLDAFLTTDPAGVRRTLKSGFTVS